MRVRSFPPVASPWFLRCALVGAVAGSAAAQCYLPGGSLAANQLPCDPFAMTAQCCPTGWTCFSNNLCVVTDPQVVSSQIPIGTASRGSCTNPLWNNTACGDFCLCRSTSFLDIFPLPKVSSTCGGESIRDERSGLLTSHKRLSQV